MAVKKNEIKFKIMSNGEWVQPRMKGYLFKCCDCGLVHRMNFSIVNGIRGKQVIQRVQFQAFREAL